VYYNTFFLTVPEYMTYPLAPKHQQLPYAAWGWRVGYGCTTEEPVALHRRDYLPSYMRLAKIKEKAAKPEKKLNITP